MKCPSVGRPRCDITITAAPWSSACTRVGSAAGMRCSEVTLPSFDRHVEVFADQHALAAQVEVGHPDDGHGARLEQISGAYCRPAGVTRGAAEAGACRLGGLLQRVADHAFDAFQVRQQRVVLVEQHAAPAHRSGIASSADRRRRRPPCPATPSPGAGSPASATRSTANLGSPPSALSTITLLPRPPLSSRCRTGARTRSAATANRASGCGRATSPACWRPVRGPRTTTPRRWSRWAAAGGRRRPGSGRLGYRGCVGVDIARILRRASAAAATGRVRGAWRRCRRVR